MSVTSQFGSNVRHLRRDIGMSQEGLALEAELNRSYVGQVERGERNISLINICKLARAIGCKSADLLIGVDLPSLKD